MRNAKKRLRHELKFYINYHEYLVLKNRLREVVLRDEHSSDEGGYYIRSLYFDDIYNSAYHEKQSGIFRRNKYRVRIYNFQDDWIRLERKEKYGEYIAKEAANLTRNEFNQLLQKDFIFLLSKSNPLLHQFYCEMRLRLLTPKVIVDYEREAYVLETGNVRVTFDKKLRAGINTWDIFSDQVVLVNAIEPGKLIMEIKYDNFLPGYIRNILQLADHERSAISKYVICRKLQNLKQRKELL